MMQGISTLPPDSPSVHQQPSPSPNNNVVLPPKPQHMPPVVPHPSSFRQQKKPPMPSPPLPLPQQQQQQTSRIDSDVSTKQLLYKWERMWG